MSVARTTLMANVSRLYHYQPFNPDYLKDVLSKQRVHCSDPANLNDPWDCRPWFDEDSLESELAVEELIEFFFSQVPTAPVGEAEVSATKGEIRNNPTYRRDILRRFSEDFLKMIPGRWRIYCMTPIANSTLMWSHYADNHRGICLEFAVENPVFGSAREVSYLSEYPKWSPQSLLDSKMPHVLLTKSDDWQYEREFRVIALGEGIPRDFDAHPLVLRGTYLSIPHGSLQAVIAGCESDVDHIRRIVREAAPAVKVKKAVRAPNHYRLLIDG